MLSIRDTVKIQSHKQVKSKQFKKIYHANSTQKRAGMAIVKSDKTDFRTKLVTETKKAKLK